MRQIRFELDIPLKSKARPRFARGRSYLPASYREWRKIAEDQLKGLWLAFDLPTVCYATVELEFHGPGRFDLDNLIGAVLDSGLPCKKTGWRGCWKDDRVTVFPEIRATWVRSREEFIRMSLNGLKPCEG